jgi:hypothetical protein
MRAAPRPWPRPTHPAPHTPHRPCSLSCGFSLTLFHTPSGPTITHTRTHESERDKYECKGYRHGVLKRAHPRRTPRSRTRPRPTHRHAPPTTPPVGTTHTGPTPVPIRPIRIIVRVIRVIRRGPAVRHLTSPRHKPEDHTHAPPDSHSIPTRPRKRYSTRQPPCVCVGSRIAAPPCLRSSATPRRSTCFASTLRWGTGARTHAHTAVDSGQCRARA